MPEKEHLRTWVVEALRRLGGKAWLIDVADDIWKNHECDLKSNREMLLKWQYQMRWAATLGSSQRKAKKENSHDRA